MARDRGRVVIVGQVPIQADWQTYYAKELAVVMSRSYGPGRYDRAYERKGVDYPIGYVRWTERRNLQEFIRLLASGSVRPALLEPALLEFADAPRAYQALHDSSGTHTSPIVFAYADTSSLSVATPGDHWERSRENTPAAGPSAVERRVAVAESVASPRTRGTAAVASIGIGVSAVGPA